MTKRASLSDLTYDPGTGLAVGMYMFTLTDGSTCFPRHCSKVEDGLSVEPSSGEALRYIIAAGMPVGRVWRVDDLPPLPSLPPMDGDLDDGPALEALAEKLEALAEKLDTSSDSSVIGPIDVASLGSVEASEPSTGVELASAINAGSVPGIEGAVAAVSGPDFVDLSAKKHGAGSINGLTQPPDDSISETAPADVTSADVAPVAVAPSPSLIPVAPKRGSGRR